MASIQQRRSAGGISWRVVWREDGLRQSQTFATRADAVTFRRHVEVHGGWPPGFLPGHGWDDDARPRRLSMAQWCDRYVATLTGVTERTRSDYARQLGRHVAPTLGRLDVGDVSREDVRGWLADLERSGLAPKSIHNLHGLLSAVMAEAVRDRHRADNPCQGTRLPRADDEATEAVFLTPQEAQLIVGCAKPDAQALILTAVGTGMRWGELTALQVADVDPFARSLRIRRAWKRIDGGSELGPPKTARSRRTITLPASVLDVLLPNLAGKTSTEFVFTTPTGRPWLGGNFMDRRWRPALREARRLGLDKQPRFHDLRHTHVAWLIAQGVALPAIQRRLGHSSITTTIDRYGHLLPSVEESAAAAVDLALDGGRVQLHDPAAVDGDVGVAEAVEL